MGLIRRFLIKFDLASIPPGSTVTGVTLTLNVVMASGGATNVTAHRVLISWGEGNSVPSNNGGEGTVATTNDATWTHRFYNTMLWTTQGGDFVAASSATKSVNDTGLYTWTSAQMIADVQQWVNTPSGNFGWIMRGSETSSHTSKHIDTRESQTASLRPKLTVTFTPPALPCPAELTGDNTVGVPDLLLLINNWGPCANPNNCPADIAPPGPPVGDDNVGVPDLLMVINNWGPCP